MKIKFVDLEVILNNFSNYRQGVEEIEEIKKKFLQDIEPLRREFNSLVSQMSTGDAGGEMVKAINERRMSEIQEEFISNGEKIKLEINKREQELGLEVRREISNIIKEWASGREDIQMVLEKSDILYSRETNDITSEILDTLRKRGLYVD
jgi:Skp family chaperone for outer membrane proteins